MTNPSLIKLSSRGIVRVSGPESLRFLQSLVTNDVHRMCGPDAPSTCSTAFLNGRGRVLFGTFLKKQSDSDYLIDVERSQTSALVIHLKQYRLRAKVDIKDVSMEHSVWSYIGDNKPPSNGFFRDPRGLIELGFRGILKSDDEASLKSNAEESVYTRLRIEQGVPDDSDFHSTPLPLDLGLHLLGGVSFSKGCYLGQELTARSHFTGVLRKRITPVCVSEGELDTGIKLFPTVTTGKRKSPKPLGVLSSACGDMGLATVRLTDVFDASGNPITLGLEDGRTAKAFRPTWWPTDEWQQQQAEEKVDS